MTSRGPRPSSSRRPSRTSRSTPAPGRSPRGTTPCSRSRSAGPRRSFRPSEPSLPRRRRLIGFKLETGESPGELEREGLRLRAETGADWVVANDASAMGSSDTNVLVLSSAGRGQWIRGPKAEVAGKLLDDLGREVANVRSGRVRCSHPLGSRFRPQSPAARGPRRPASAAPVGLNRPPGSARQRGAAAWSSWPSGEGRRSSGSTGSRSPRAQSRAPRRRPRSLVHGPAPSRCPASSRPRCSPAAGERAGPSGSPPPQPRPARRPRRSWRSSSRASG